MTQNQTETSWLTNNESSNDLHIIIDHSYKGICIEQYFDRSVSHRYVSISVKLFITLFYSKLRNIHHSHAQTGAEHGLLIFSVGPLNWIGYCDYKHICY